MNKKDWNGNSRAITAQKGLKADHTTKGRENNDFYATDPIAIDVLLKCFDLLKFDANKVVWECAAGTGNLSDRLIELGAIVYATDLIDRGNSRVKPGVDFLQCTELPCDCNIILTNPPFKYATEFAQKALELLPDGGYYIAFMNISYITGQKRYNSIYKNGCLKYFCPFTKRVECWRNNDKEKHGGRAMVDFAWYIFKKGYGGLPNLFWLDR